MLKASPFVKIRVVVPRENVSAIRELLGTEGAGEQGNYDYCSFSFPVTGRFRPRAGSHPAIGEIGKIEEAAEEVIEVICHQSKVEQVIAAVREAHPYEEPAIDIMPRYEIK